MAQQKLARGGPETVDEVDGCGGGVLSALNLRLAVNADIPAMHNIRKSVTENILSVSSALGHDDYRPFLVTDGETWIGEVDGQMAGFGAIDQCNSSIWALFVAPEFESQGVGKALLNKLLARAKSLGLTSLALTTTPGTRAERFYIRQGWQKKGAAPNGEVKLEFSVEGFYPTSSSGLKK